VLTHVELLQRKLVRHLRDDRLCRRRVLAVWIVHQQRLAMLDGRDGVLLVELMTRREPGVRLAGTEASIRGACVRRILEGEAQVLVRRAQKLAAAGKRFRKVIARVRLPWVSREAENEAFECLCRPLVTAGGEQLGSVVIQLLGVEPLGERYARTAAGGE
jgi:hypothetical protein